MDNAVRPEGDRKQPRPLFPFERVLETTDGVLNLAFDLIGLPLRLQLSIANDLAGRLLDGAFDLLRRSGDPILVHDFLHRRGLSRRSADADCAEKISGHCPLSADLRQTR